MTSPPNRDQGSDRDRADTGRDAEAGPGELLALFPALLVLVSLLGLAGESTTARLLDNLRRLTPGSARDVIRDAVEQLQGRSRVGSLMAVVGLVVALWSASGYVAAFIRSANAVYDMPEARPVWKVLPLRLALTVTLMVLACADALIVVFTGSLARQRAIAGGLPEDEEPYVRPRETRAWSEQDRRRMEG
ncbi:YihY/virulence factor BrkB family protein [Streptomyces sp. NBC_00207]|uniref:YihY/virulence factor BrkB family protein n=1 Tax=Streptomyces sp. NBC_00207 TaxID=2903635 RepID=UPI0032456744